MGLGALKAMMGHSEEMALPVQTIVELMGHSMAIGVVMAGATLIAGNVIQKAKSPETPEQKLSHLFGAANILFLCVGLSGVMILVNNNLVRAFAAVSALALVRFRVKLDQKSLSISLLFAILGGMSIGLQEVMLGWIMIGVYVFLLSLLLLAVTVIRRQAMRSTTEKVSAANLILQKLES